MPRSSVVHAPLPLSLALIGALLACAGPPDAPDAPEQPEQPEQPDVVDAGEAHDGGPTPDPGDTGAIPDAGTVPDGGAPPAVTSWKDYVAGQGSAPWGGWERGTWKGGVAQLAGPPFLAADVEAKIGEGLARLGDKDAVFEVGLLGSGRGVDEIGALMEWIEATSAEEWKDVVRAQTVAFHDHAGRVFWQLGNEINSRHYSESLRAWAGLAACNDGGSIDGCRNDDVTIPWFAEYFLAPTIEAMREVEPGAWIAMGSIANAGNPDALPWLSALLDHTFSGTFAPSLVGHTVAEYVDILTIHYLVSSGSASQWREQLDAYHELCRASPRCTGVWATEEVGITRAELGVGGANGLRTVFRSLEYWHSEGLGPRQGRMSIYGWNTAGSGVGAGEAMELLAGFFGAQPLAPAQPTVVGFEETYAFSTPDGKKVTGLFGPGTLSSLPAGVEVHRVTSAAHVLVGADDLPLVTDASDAVLLLE